MAEQKICREFSRSGKCQFKNCKFRHIQNGQQRAGDKNSSRKPSNGISNSEREFQAWKKAIPLSTAASAHRLSLLFGEARRLLDIDVGVRQSIVQALAEETALGCIKTMIEEFIRAQSQRRGLIFRTQTIPFMEIISHPDVQQSLLLEQTVGTIYNFLYGVGGVRASNLLSACADAIVHCTKDETAAVWLETCLAVFMHIVEINSLAYVQDSLKECAQQFEKIFDAWIADDLGNFLHRSKMYLERLLRRFEIGNSIPTIAEDPQSQQPKAKVAFTVQSEPPGGRHDNDHADICQISIMPTYQEICSSRNEYLPVYDPAQWHLTGLHGLLDRNFRLLREDTIGVLRDAIHAEIQPLKGLSGKRNQQRTVVYKNTRVVNMGFDRMNGFQFKISFPQPSQVAGMTALMREDWWKMSKKLQAGALVCLILQGMDLVFCTVVDEQVPKPTRRERKNDRQQQQKSSSLWKSSEEASLVLELTDASSRPIQLILQQYIRKNVGNTLVEFPGVLLPAFEPTLKALQMMKQTDSLPFSEILTPSYRNASSSTEITPPIYATQPGFEFDLKCLMNDSRNFYVQPGKPSDIKSLRENSSLDDAQASALVDMLQRKVGLVQGPPGTGKSYTGIALIKVLLANNAKRPIDGRSQLGPIICVTYTNHALDQLLESLLRNDVTKQIVRMGSQSKSEIVEPYRLRVLAKNFDKTKHERYSMWTSHQSLDDCIEEFGQIGLDGGISPTKIKLYLERNYPDCYNQLFGVDEDGYKQAHTENHRKVFQRWRKFGGKAACKSVIRDVRELESTPLMELSQPEREKLYSHWQRQVLTEMQEDLMKLCISHGIAKRRLGVIRDEVDLRCLSQADVIGVTTSGLARNLNMLRRLQSKIVLCEEAGEVLESHLLTALLPSVEHVILIGDHYQLRPQVQKYELSRENKNGGEKYSLDVSLFERLVDLDSTMGCGLPYSTLQIQRRMHPSIAQLVRDTLYPQLEDAPSVLDYPTVTGVRKRLFWLDHRYPEGDLSNADVTATSHWNNHEIEMTLALVHHLIRQGRYQNGEIAVLTPYLGQLHRLRKRLSSSFEITLGERDQDDLDKAGLQEEQSPSSIRVKATLLQSIRVATIDNFQGEEASVVVISLVRSNPENRCGFLRTSNRINVLLSRAKHGMYIIGNSMTSIHVPMWADVIEILQRNENIGKSLELQCPRHPDTLITVSQPDDFPRMSPEGGCNLRCIKRLSCGHACIQKCHSEFLHNNVYCLEPCQRPRKGCTHPCPIKCGDKCPAKCLVKIFQADRRLGCGHVMQSLPCWQDQDISTVLCPVLVEKTVPNCGHKVRVACHTDVTSSTYMCKVQCQHSLVCGHSCQNECFKCVKLIDSGEIHTDHGTCRQVCGRNQSTCAHRCEEPCHSENQCPPCQKPCQVDCGHSVCAKKCSEPCSPCAEERCLSSCPHSACTMPCAAPCDHIPCSMRCEKFLACGHQCPSVCGEKCPPIKYCQACSDDEVKDYTVDFILGETYKEINLDENPCVFPKCGHFLTIENMDALMDLPKYYVLDAKDHPSDIAASSEPFSIHDIKKCPSCRGPLRDITRYGRLVRRAILDESTKKLILYLNREYVPLAQELPQLIKQLQETKPKDSALWPHNIRLNGERETQVASMRKIISARKEGRWKEILELRKRISEYNSQVAPEEQPYSRVYNLVARARLQQNITGKFEFGSGILQTNGFLQATALSLRLDIALLADFLKHRHDDPKAAETKIHIDLSRMRIECEHLIETASESKRIPHQVEGYIFAAQLYAFEKSNSSASDTGVQKADEQLKRGQEALTRAKALCDSFPGQTRGLMEEAEEAEKMLRGSTFYTAVSSSERMAVIAAMAREFRGTGHWYYCQNGHPFTIGECGMAMQRSFCPECGAPVGGENHTAVRGVTHARDLDTAFTQMVLN